MSARKGSKPAKSPATVVEMSGFRVAYRALRKRLEALGCVFCPTCYAYLYPDHQHATARKEAA